MNVITHLYLELRGGLVNPCAQIVNWWIDLPAHTRRWWLVFSKKIYNTMIIFYTRCEMREAILYGNGLV